MKQDNARLLRLLPLRRPKGLHTFGLRFTSRCTLSFMFLGNWSRCHQWILWRSALPLRRALESLDSSIQLVTFCNQQGHDVFGRHRVLRVTRWRSRRLGRILQVLWKPIGPRPERSSSVISITKSLFPSASSPWRRLLQDLSGANSCGNLIHWRGSSPRESTSVAPPPPDRSVV